MHAKINGIDVAYTDEGKGSTLLFVHGFPLSRAAWGKQMEAFRSTHRVIAPDLRGLGESEATAGPIPMSRYAEDLFALLQHLEAGPVTLVGHSMGGYVALAFAKAFPQAIQGLGLVGTKCGADSPEVAAGRRATAEKVRLDGSSVVVSAMAPKMLSPHNMDATMAASVRGFMARSKPEGVIGALLGMAERPDAGAWVGAITARTLVITGADDSLIPPSESEVLARAIPAACLQLIPNAGHLVAFEQPEAFNRALAAWLEGGHAH